MVIVEEGLWVNFADVGNAENGRKADVVSFEHSVVCCRVDVGSLADVNDGLVSESRYVGEEYIVELYHVQLL